MCGPTDLGRNLGVYEGRLPALLRGGVDCLPGEPALWKLSGILLVGLDPRATIAFS